MPLRGERGPGIGGHAVQHRRPRGNGGTRRPETNGVQNLLLLNTDCHEWVESHRSWSLKYGFLVPQSGVPAAQPLWLHGVPIDRREGAPLEGQLVMLTDDPGYRPVEELELPEVIGGQ